MSLQMASMAFFLFLLPLIAGYSFEFTAPPTQCAPLPLRIINGQGNPPYTALVVPFGPAPGSTEQRKISQQQFNSTDVNITLSYPSSSNFVIMVSDSDGIGTGGTSVPTTVTPSSNSSCLTTTPPLLFSFQIIPNNAINQCQATTLAWDNNTVGDIELLLLIPGGQSSRINVVNSGSAPGGTTGFSWTPDIRAGTNIIISAGDSRGVGTGGSVNTAVGNNPSQNSSCIDSSSPSSTAGTPAGAVQTSSVPTGNSSSGGGTNTGAVAGGVLGGIAALAVVGVLALLFIRQRRRQQHPAAHGVDLLPEVAQRDPEQPPEFYQPEPFIVPSTAGTEENGGISVGRLTMSDVGRRYSALSTTDQSESVYATTTGTSGNMLAVGGGGRSTSYGPSSNRKSPTGLPVLRPVNFVQHEDAGELPEAGGSGQADEPETVELPPSYNSVRR